MIHLSKTHVMRWLLPIALLVATAVYWPGLSGSWLFDDYPNIVDNPGVQPHGITVPALVRAALSSPASDFKRPLASLSFAANYLAGGLNPWGWKLFNLVLHLLNGTLVFLLAKALLLATSTATPAQAPTNKVQQRAHVAAVLITAGWMLLPINLTAVLYVVQREESMANLFVLLGLVGYAAGRLRMLNAPDGRGWLSFWVCAASLTLCTIVGLMAKETAAMLPLYAGLVEWIVFRFGLVQPHAAAVLAGDAASGEAFKARIRGRWDRRIAGLFTVVLILPLMAGLIWLLPNVLSTASWATRDFTLDTRLLSETRVVCDYIVWTLLPTPAALSFYHDQFRVSAGLLSPWTTLASLLGIIVLVLLALWLRRRQPLAALGIALFLGCHVMTGTIIPLELVYEHRNYFASFGVLLAVVPWLAAAPIPSGTMQPSVQRYRWLLPRRTLLACLLLWWTGLTAATAYAWGDPLRLAQQLAARAPDSPRAQYELGRTYIMYSHYDQASPYTRLAYAPLEKAASFPESSILPQQALIFMNSRMGLPLKSRWWDSMIAKLKVRKPGVQDESSLAALAQCARDGACPLPTDPMVQAFDAALDHPKPSARLQATYGDYAWNVLGNRTLGMAMIEGAVKSAPSEPAYRITLVRMLATAGYYTKAHTALAQLRALNFGGRLDSSIHSLQVLLDERTTPASDSKRR